MGGGEGGPGLQHRRAEYLWAVTRGGGAFGFAFAEEEKLNRPASGTGAACQDRAAVRTWTPPERTLGPCEMQHRQRGAGLWWRRVLSLPHSAQAGWLLPPRLQHFNVPPADAQAAPASGRVEAAVACQRGGDTLRRCRRPRPRRLASWPRSPSSTARSWAHVQGEMDCRETASSAAPSSASSIAARTGLQSKSPTSSTMTLLGSLISLPRQHPRGTHLSPVLELQKVTALLQI